MAVALHEVAVGEHARGVGGRVGFAEFEQADAAQARLGAVRGEAAGGGVAEVEPVHVTHERVLVVVAAVEREVAARVAQCRHLAAVHVRASDRFAEDRTRPAHRAVQHVAATGERARALDGVGREGRHLLEALVELLRRDVLERDRGHGPPVAVAFGQRALHAAEPRQGLRGGRAIAVRVGQIEPARVARVFGGREVRRRLAEYGVVGGESLGGVVARIDHHDAHGHAARPVGHLDGQCERAGLADERVVTVRAVLPGVARVEAAGELAVDAVLFAGEDAALEVVVAIGGGEWDARAHDRPEESGEAPAHLGARVVEQRVHGVVRHLGLGRIGQPRPVERAAPPRLEPRHLAHVVAGPLPAPAQERAHPRRIVPADLIAGEHHQIGFGLADRRLDERHGVRIHVRPVLHVRHLQHPEGAVPMSVPTEAQSRHTAHSNPSAIQPPGMAIGICDAGTPPRNRYVAWARRWDAGTVRWKFVTDM